MSNDSYFQRNPNVIITLYSSSVFLFSSFHPPSLSFFLSRFVFCRWQNWLLSVPCWNACAVFAHKALCWSTLCASMPCRWLVAWPTLSRGGSSTGTWQPGIETGSYKKLRVIFFKFKNGFAGVVNYLYCFSSTQKFTGHYWETWPKS